MRMYLQDLQKRNLYPVEPARSKFDLHGLSVNDAEKELRGLARPEQKGDVMLSNGDTVPFANAVRLAQEGIESGALKPNPGQLHFGLGLAMRDTARVLDGVREAQRKAGKAVSEPFSLENPTPQTLKEREQVKKDAAAGQPPLLSESSPEGWGKGRTRRGQGRDEAGRPSDVRRPSRARRHAGQARQIRVDDQGLAQPARIWGSPTSPPDTALSRRWSWAPGSGLARTASR